jgi:hypothetical protein
MTKREQKAESKEIDDHIERIVEDMLKNAEITEERMPDGTWRLVVRGNLGGEADA